MSTRTNHKLQEPQHIVYKYGFAWLGEYKSSSTIQIINTLRLMFTQVHDGLSNEKRPSVWPVPQKPEPKKGSNQRSLVERPSFVEDSTTEAVTRYEEKLIKKISH